MLNARLSLHFMSKTYLLKKYWNDKIIICRNNSNAGDLSIVQHALYDVLTFVYISIKCFA